MKKKFDWKKIFNQQTILLLMMGFSSGLPLGLIQGTLQAWMKEESVDLSIIGLFAIVQIPYTLKFIWSPLMDRYQIFGWGRRRGWMLFTQICLVGLVMLMSQWQSSQGIWTLAIFAVAVAFFGASQDIVIDAWRREKLTDDELGWGSSVHVTGYLLAYRLMAGAFAMILADYLPWSQVYQVMGFSLVIGIIATWMCDEPQVDEPPPKNLKDAVVLPFLDYFSKPGAIWILAFILLYKVGDNMALQMTVPFYLDLGFAKSEIGTITKVFGWISMTVGGLAAGALILRLHIIPSLVYFGIIQALSTFGFVALAMVGKNLSVLTAVIVLENFAIGMATTAFSAFLASVTNKRFTATQFALLTSFMGIPRSITTAPTGFMAEHMGWPLFFTFCVLIAIPGLLLIYPLSKKLAK